MNRSRLSKKIDQQSKKNLFFSLLGIILILFIFIKFGIPLLVNFSLFIAGSKNTDEETKNNERTFIPPPTLNSMPSATSSANVVVSGFATAKQNVDLYINDNLIDKMMADDKGQFSFETKINNGENIIKAKTIIDKKESEFSNPISVTFGNKAPELNVDSPMNGQSFSKDQTTIEVKGTTDADAKVTVNSFWAITDSLGRFSYQLPLTNGENKIKITAVDQAGNKTEKEIKVTSSQ